MENLVYVYLILHIVSGVLFREWGFVLATERISIPKGVHETFLIGACAFIIIKCYMLWKYPPFGGFWEAPASVGAPVREGLNRGRVFRYSFCIADEKNYAIMDPYGLDMRRSFVALFYFLYAILPEILHTHSLNRFAAFLLLLFSAVPWLFCIFVRVMWLSGMRIVRATNLRRHLVFEWFRNSARKPKFKCLRFVDQIAAVTRVMVEFTFWLMYTLCRTIAWLVFDNPADSEALKKAERMGLAIVSLEFDLSEREFTIPHRGCITNNSLVSLDLGNGQYVILPGKLEHQFVERVWAKITSARPERPISWPLSVCFAELLLREVWPSDFKDAALVIQLMACFTFLPLIALVFRSLFPALPTPHELSLHSLVNRSLTAELGDSRFQFTVKDQLLRVEKEMCSIV